VELNGRTFAGETFCLANEENALQERLESAQRVVLEPTPSTDVLSV
jgi:hypothetical protein